MLLAIDTAGPNCAVAISLRHGRNVEILAESQDQIGRGHAERLMPMIDGVLKEASAGFADIGRIAVTTGPGSFTGVRIGLSASRALALALKCEAVGIGVLDAMIWPVKAKQAKLVVAVLDARRGEVFSAVGGSSTQIERQPMLTTIEALAKHIGSIRSVSDKPVVLVGSASNALSAELDQYHIDSIVENEAAFANIDVVSTLGWLADARHKPEPLYLRQPDAKPQSFAVSLETERR